MLDWISLTMTGLLAKRFTVLRLLWNNVVARPIRSTLSIIAIALQIVLVLLIVGMTSGVLADWGKRVEGVGADLLIQPPNSSIFFGATSAVMPASIGPRLTRVEGVERVAPVFILMDLASFGVVYGIDYQSFSTLGTGFQFVEGGPFEGPDEIIADDLVARAKHLHLGQRVTLASREYTLRGIVWHGKGARFYIPLKTAQDVAGAEDRISLFYVRSNGDTEGVRARIVKLLPGHRIRSVSEYMSLMSSSNLPELQPFLRCMVALGVAISFLVVLLNMHTMVLERTREIGILKALGTSRTGIIGMFVGETLLLAALGILFGLAATKVICLALGKAAPTLAILISSSWIFRAALLAVAGSVLGALYPALRASGFDPIDALACE